MALEAREYQGERRTTFEVVKGCEGQRERAGRKGRSERVQSIMKWKEKDDGERLEIRRRGTDV